LTQIRADLAIVTAWYPPEPAPYGQMMQELASFLVQRGLLVDVFTSVPNYPQGAIYPGWRNRLLQHEQPIPGLRIWRVGVLAGRGEKRRHRGRLWRIAGFLTFTALCFVTMLRKSKPRVVFAVLQPLSVGPMLFLFARLKGSRLIVNLQDLHPDAAVLLGLVKNRLLIGVLRRIEAFVYRSADAIAVICDAFKRHCVARGANISRVVVIPNWIDLDEIRPLSRASSLRRDLGISEGAFVALYAGSLGLISGAEMLVEAASKLAAHSNIHFVFVGDGVLVPRLTEQKRHHRLANVHFLPFQPRESLNEVQSLGDVSLVTLLPGHGQSSVPSKVLGYMAAARPVIAAVDANSETAKFIRDAQAGIVVPPGSVMDLIDALLKLQAEPHLARSLGLAGRRYLECSLTREGVLAMYARLIDDEIQRTR